MAVLPKPIYFNFTSKHSNQLLSFKYTTYTSLGGYNCYFCNLDTSNFIYFFDGMRYIAGFYHIVPDLNLSKPNQAFCKKCFDEFLENPDNFLFKHSLGLL